jgi:TonB-linked SusC/RagA family outer membrane protein
MSKNILFKVCLIHFLLCNTFGAIYGIGEKDSLDIDLGFGVVQSKNKTTVAALSITGEELKQTAALNLQEALYGRLLGLTAINTGGFQGERNYGALLNIRGLQTSSEDQNNILILVDGFERPIDKLTIDEVESVTILKDAAATVLYGYKGINGAIMVKTKRGLNDGFKVNVGYDHKFAFDPKIPDFVDAYTYANALNEARINDGLSPAYSAYETDAFKSNKYPKVYPNVDWKKESLRNVQSENQVNLSIKGGNSKLQYFTLLNYQDVRGLLNNTEENDGYSTQLKYSKANIRMNIDYWLTPTTSLQVNATGNFYETNRPAGADASEIMSYLFTIPASAFPVKTENSLWGGNTNSTYGTKNLSALIQGSGYRKYHGRSYYLDAQLTQNLGALLEGLSATVRMGYDNLSEIYEHRTRAFEYGNDRYIFDNAGNVIETTSYRAGNKAGNLEFSRALEYQWRKSNISFSLEYKKTLEENNFQASLIYATESNVNDGRYNTIYRRNIGGYLHYDRSGKYLADLALLHTGSNRSYPEKYAFSPVLSLGWVASEESFLANHAVIDFLKLRASAGILHSDYVPLPGLSFEDYSGGHGDYYFKNGYEQNWGFFLGYIPTTSFNLETAYKYNVGIDMNLLKSFELTADIYYQRRNNILQTTEGLNSAVMGIPSSYVNKGVVDSKGVEIGLNYTKKINDLWIYSGLMFTYGTNKIVDMVETPQAYAYLSRIGLPVNQYFGLEAIGFFKDQNDIDNSPVQQFSVVRAGDVKYKDQNKDGFINENDEVALGYSSIVPEINYAFKLGVEYKGIGANFLFQGAGNYSQALTVQGVYTPLVGNVNLSRHYYENAWRENGNNASPLYPRLTSETNPNNYRPSSIWYADASFLKLRNCEIYYKMENMKIYLKGENLLSFDNIDIMDPEVVSTAYPVLKSITIGAAINF